MTFGIKEINIFCLGLVALLSYVFTAHAQQVVCKNQLPSGNQISCNISSEADCTQVNDYPYARNLFCPASYRSAQKMIEALKTFINADSSLTINSSFLFFQTPSSKFPNSQTEQSCMTAPFKISPLITSGIIEGGGVPLCNLVGYVTSPGPSDPDLIDQQNPLPPNLRLFPSYFEALWTGNKEYPLYDFTRGGRFDGLITNLGASSTAGFITVEPSLTINSVYGPDNWKNEPAYNGISGGGGGGWGAEILTLAQSQSQGVTLFTFGGGGGGGLSSTPHPIPKNNFTYLAGGGGGGAQFANGFTSQGKSYNGLGLGAGGSQYLAAADSKGNKIQSEISYSYNDAINNNPPQTNHAILINDYSKQLVFLKQKLISALASGQKVILKGGGGMGAGAEYYDAKLDEINPHALSTQAGFQFRFEIMNKKAVFSVPRRGYSSNILTEQLIDQNQNLLYQRLGSIFQTANRQALNHCGNSYTNYNDCVCPTTQAIVTCLAMSTLGVSKPNLLPKWLGNQYCVKSTTGSSVAMGVTAMRNDVINALPPVIEPLDIDTSAQTNLTATSCKNALQSYFNLLDGPPPGP